MRTFFAVARREVVEKKFVFAAAVVASVIPLAVPLVRAMSAASAREARGFTAVLLAATVANAVALALGTSLFAGDLVSRRSGFYFSRPISSAALWAGKVAAGLGIALAAAAIILAPTLLVDGGIAPLGGVEGGAAGAAVAVAAALLLLLVVANAGSLIVRSGSRWAALDLAAMAAIGLVTAAAASRLWRISEDPSRFLSRLLLGAGVAIAVAFLAGSYRAVTAGRTDLHAAHRAISVTAWSLLGGATVAFTAWSAWALAAPPSALDSVYGAYPLGSLGWVNLDGRARGFKTGFLYDTRTGRHVRTGGFWSVASEDGSTVAWVEGDAAAHGPWELRTLRLEEPRAVPADPKISFRGKPELFLSSDGRRLGAIDFGMLSVFDLPSGRSLGSVRVAVPPREDASARFVGPAAVRIVRTHTPAVGETSPQAQILEYDVSAGRLTQTGTLESQRTWGSQTNPAGDRFVGRGADGRVALRDARTGAVIATLREGPPMRTTWSSFLDDGRMLLALGDEDSCWLEVFSPEGQKLRRIELGGRGRLRPGAEVSPGRLAVTWIPDPETFRQRKRTLEIVDLDRGTSSVVAEGLLPIGFWWWNAVKVSPGSEASKLFIDQNDALVRFDPATGRKTVILGGDRAR